MSKPREYTAEEVRDKVLDHVRSMVDYWETVEDHAGGRPKTTRDRLSGLAFSILAMLDGGSADLPGFIVAPMPHKDNRAYHIRNGENWFPENDKSQVNGDIAGGLHEHYHRDGY